MKHFQVVHIKLKTFPSFSYLDKEQADRLSGFTSSGSTDSTTSKNVQISTVDAFQVKTVLLVTYTMSALDHLVTLINTIRVEKKK